MRSMKLFRIGSAPTRSPRRRNFSSCMAYLNIILYQDVKPKSDHHPARPHPSGDRLNRARQVRQADCRCRLDRKYQHGPYYRWTGWINGKPTTKTITEEVARECQKRI